MYYVIDFHYFALYTSIPYFTNTKSIPMKPLAKLFIFNLITILTVSLSAQDIYFTISGEYNNTKVSIDSLLFENLSNNSSLLFSNLPIQDEYLINLSKQEIEESTGIRTMKNISSFTMVKCIPGEFLNRNYVDRVKSHLEAK